ncbi:MAG: hypothetical protein GY866_11820 [Proteobacteria bacterium]|nr:hypothetical protein [Pseudomonadota bacterium]
MKLWDFTSKTDLIIALDCEEIMKKLWGHYEAFFLILELFEENRPWNDAIAFGTGGRLTISDKVMNNSIRDRTKITWHKLSAKVP